MEVTSLDLRNAIRRSDAADSKALETTCLAELMRNNGMEIPFLDEVGVLAPPLHEIVKTANCIIAQ